MSEEKATGSVSEEKEYGTYNAPWTQTFDLAFLFMWIYALIGLTVYTIWYDNKGAVDREFFAFGLTKIVIVGIISLIGGLIGKHKYTVPAWNFKRRYTRSYEGSACVFLTTLIAIFVFHGEFDTARQFIAALIILPPLMTFAEAFAPPLHGHAADDAFRLHRPRGHLLLELVLSGGNRCFTTPSKTKTTGVRGCQCPRAF